MKARFAPRAVWAYLRSTYWFLPTLLTLICMALAVLFTTLDRNAWDRASLPGWVFGGGSDGARALLSAVAGSMITVVSVTFSVTIVALTVSSQHFGPRLLNSFMRDTSAQVVLGIFIGTFAYCLLVLRTVQGDGEEYDRFIPHLGVTAALALSLVSVGALIYYIHHVAASLQVSEITRSVAVDLERSIDRLYPEQMGNPGAPADATPAVPAGAAEILSIRSGYVQHVEADQAFGLARQGGVVIWLHVRPGDFVTEGLPIAAVHPPPPGSRDEFATALNDALVLGADRTSDQDAGFPLQQLVEVTLHALSTGTNEPFTALTCIDRLGQGLSKLAARRMPSPLRVDREGHVRLVTPRHSFTDLLDAALDPIRTHATASPEVGKHLLVLLARVAHVARRDEDRASIIRHADMVKRTMERWQEDDAYREQIDKWHRVVVEAATGARPRQA
jgi:uncharacterized membrane protein